MTEPHQGFSQLGHWGPELTKRLSKSLLSLPSVVTSHNLDTDKVTSLRKKLLQKEKTGLKNNSILAILSTGNISILMLPEKGFRGSTGLFKI